MITINADNCKDGSAHMQTTMFLHGMNTSLITILLDVSGSFLSEKCQTTLTMLSDAIKMIAPNAIINVIQFDMKIECVHRVTSSALKTYIKDHKILGGAGTYLEDVANDLNGKTESRFNFEKRQGAFANTPVLIVSDGWFSDNPDKFFDDSAALIQHAGE